MDDDAVAKRRQAGRDLAGRRVRATRSRAWRASSPSAPRGFARRRPAAVGVRLERGVESDPLGPIGRPDSRPDRGPWPERGDRRVRAEGERHTRSGELGEPVEPGPLVRPAGLRTSASGPPQAASNIGCIDATSPARGKTRRDRGRTRRVRAVNRRRRGGRARSPAASNASSAWSTAASPMTWKPACSPAVGAPHDVLGEIVRWRSAARRWCRGGPRTARAGRRCASRASRRRTGRRPRRRHPAREPSRSRTARPSTRRPQAAARRPRARAGRPGRPRSRSRDRPSRARDAMPSEAACRSAVRCSSVRWPAVSVANAAVRTASWASRRRWPSGP